MLSFSLTLKAGFYVPKIHGSQVLHAAGKEIPKGEFSCLTRNSIRLFVSNAKKLDQICLVEKPKSVMVTKYFNLATSTSSSNER